MAGSGTGRQGGSGDGCGPPEGGAAGGSRGGARALLERSREFTAQHHYRHPEWDEARNREVFGALADPHPHDYRVTVRVSGVQDPVTGFVADLRVLDEALDELIGPLEGGSLNEVPGLEDGRLLPSCENLARIWYQELRGRVAPARVESVRVAESPELAAEYGPDEG